MQKIAAFLLLALGCSACDKMSRELHVKNLRGFSFSYRDVQEQCIVKREGGQAMGVYCETKRLRAVERSCVGQMEAGLKDPKFFCGGGLWQLNNKCYIEMLTTKKGNVRCKKEK